MIFRFYFGIIFKGIQTHQREEYVVCSYEPQNESRERSNVACGNETRSQSTDLIDVDFVQADGDELEFLRTKFPALKVGSGRVEKLTGNQAMEAAALLLAKV